MFDRDNMVISETNNVNLEVKAKEFLKVLHRRLGYIRVDN